MVTEIPLQVTAENLRELRKDARLTQTECGALVGVDKFAICRVETGQRPLTVAESLVLSAALLGHPVPMIGRA